MCVRSWDAALEAMLRCRTIAKAHAKGRHVLLTHADLVRYNEVTRTRYKDLTRHARCFFTSSPRVFRPSSLPFNIKFRAVKDVSQGDEPLYWIMDHPELAQDVGSGIFGNREFEPGSYPGSFITDERATLEEIEAKGLKEHALEIDPPRRTRWEEELGLHKDKPPEWFSEYRFLVFPEAAQETVSTQSAGMHIMNDVNGLAAYPNVLVDRDADCWTARKTLRRRSLCSCTAMARARRGSGAWGGEPWRG
jgi:hypothetical protein